MYIIKYFPNLLRVCGKEKWPFPYVYAAVTVTQSSCYEIGPSLFPNLAGVQIAHKEVILQLGFIKCLEKKATGKYHQWPPLENKDPRPTFIQLMVKCKNVLKLKYILILSSYLINY